MKTPRGNTPRSPKPWKAEQKKPQTTQTVNIMKTMSHKDRDLQKDLRVQATRFQ